ncbi:MAG: phenylalanine--tRNA ligase subunit beta, partial [Woeseiaceae bacterium]
AIAGGNAGPVVVETSADHLPSPTPIDLRKRRITQLLGLEIDDGEIARILRRLRMQIENTEGGWRVTPPCHRFDMEYEVDLIEEVARIHGYDSIPETTLSSAAPLETVTETRVPTERAASILVARDYQEVVTYSFIDAEANRRFTGTESPLVLSNPISSELSVMQASLWPGLVAAAAANTARQQDRVRLFETSRSYHGTLEDHQEVARLAGLATGPRFPEQWATATDDVDFFDIKADVEAVLALATGPGKLRFAPVEHAALQPGQAAQVLRDDVVIGVVGKLHPELAKDYDLKRGVYLFELDADKALASVVPEVKTISKYPAIRRDIAIVVDDNVSAEALIEAVAGSAPDLIRDVRIFDIYRGDRIEAGLKSVAIGLILQETSRTLTDEDADTAMAAAIAALKEKFAAHLRD